MLKDKKRKLQKISENEEQREQAKEELTKVVAQHGATKARLEEQEQLTFLEEQRTRVSGNISKLNLLYIRSCQNKALYFHGSLIK